MTTVPERTTTQPRSRGAYGGAFAHVLRHLVRERVRLDTRSLALARLLLATLAIGDLFARARNFSFLYVESGVVPQHLAELGTPDGAISLYYLTTDPREIALLFVAQGLVALLLLVGYRTRLATVLTFLFVVSLDFHNPFVLSYADVLFRLLLFWAIFLPLGERWSVDAVRADRSPRASWVGVAGGLALCQPIAMYAINGYHKATGTHWVSGEATPLVMGLDDTTFLLGDAVRAFPTLLRYGGLLWFAMLLASPLLVLLTGRARLLFASLFVGGHATFAVTVRIGAFPYVAMAGLLLFVQTAFWTDLRRALDATGLDWEPRYEAARIRLADLARRLPDGRAAVERIRDRVGPAGDRVGLRVERVGRVADRLAAVRAFCYDTTVLTVLVAVLLVSGTSGLQAAGVTDDRVGLADDVEGVADRIAVSQPEWSIFAPRPRTTDRYYVFAANTTDGEQLDAYNHRPLTFDRPHDELQKQYGTYRERFYMNNVRKGASRGNDLPLELAEHVCETSPEEHGVELTHVNMYVVEEDVTVDTIDAPAERDRESERFYTHGCGDRGPAHLVDPPF